MDFGVVGHTIVECSTVDHIDVVHLIAEHRVVGYMVSKYGVAEHELVECGAADKQVEYLWMKPKFHQD